MSRFPFDTPCLRRATIFLFCLLALTSAVKLTDANFDASLGNLDVSLGSRVGAVSEAQSMTYLLNTLGKFKSFSLASRQGLAARHQAEEARLREAMTKSGNKQVQVALAQTLNSNQDSLTETKRVYDNMVNFATSMGTLLQAATQGGVAGCDDVQLKCHAQASCSETTKGPICICNEGYVGDGKVCHAPLEFKMNRLLFEGRGGKAADAKSISIGVFENNKVAIVFRDSSMGDIGRIIVGSVREGGKADMAPPEQFNKPGTMAFDPVVTGTEARRILVSWRDANTKGAAHVRAASMGVSGVRGADKSLLWSDVLYLDAGEQAHKHAVLPMPGNRVVVLLSKRVVAQPGTHILSQSTGAGYLLELSGPANGGPEPTKIKVIDESNFLLGPVCRIEVTKIGASRFVVAGRAAPSIEEYELPTGPSAVTLMREALAVSGRMDGDNLVFSSQTLNLEPERTGMWARGLSLISPNTFAYAYQHTAPRQDGQGLEPSIRMAVVQVDADNKMQILKGPDTIHAGFSPYVQMLSVPYEAADPHTLVYLDDGGSSKIHVCRWHTPQLRNQTLNKCEEFAWFKQSLSSVSGVHLGGGKSFMAFTTKDGTPYYGIFGLSKK